MYNFAESFLLISENIKVKVKSISKQIVISMYVYKDTLKVIIAI